MKKTGDSRRVQRMEKELQQTIAGYLLTGFKTPLPGLVTVARVLMPGDLRTARVYISVLGTDKDRVTVMEKLQDRSFEIQNYIAKQLKARFCPKLTFFEDVATQNVLKIEKILYDLELEKSNREISTPVSSDADDQ